MSEQRSRREFLRTAALTGAGVWMADKAWAVDKTPQGKIIGANDKINFACIGVGGKGDSDSNEAAQATATSSPSAMWMIIRLTGRPRNGPTPKSTTIIA